MTMESRHDRKFRHYLINNDLQLRVIGYSLVYLAVIMAITCATIFYPVLRDMMMSEGVEIQYRAAQTFLILIKRLALAAIFAFVLTFLHQVLISHRICGPLVNFTNTFNKVKEGDLTRTVHLRKIDYLKGESLVINEMLDSLRQRIGKIKEDNDRLAESLEDFSNRIEGITDDPETKAVLADAKHHAAALAQDVGAFKLTAHTTDTASENSVPS